MWYAEHLSTAIARSRYVTLAFPIDGEAPTFRTLGGHKRSFPQMFHTRAPQVMIGGVQKPEVRIKYGRADFERTLRRLGEDGLRSWWMWLLNIDPVTGKLRRSEDNKRLRSTALFRRTHGTVEENKESDPLARRAALIAIGYAAITPFRHDTETDPARY